MTDDRALPQTTPSHPAPDPVREALEIRAVNFSKSWGASGLNARMMAAFAMQEIAALSSAPAAAGERDEREAFIEAHHRSFDLTEISNAWGDPVFKHPHIESMWEGWKRRSALSSKWSCAARKQGTPGGNDPADCDWPVCGCDPVANKVIAALEESGAALSSPASPLERITDADITTGAMAIARSHGQDPDELAPLTEMCTEDNAPVPWWMVFTEEAEACLRAVTSPLERSPRGDEDDEYDDDDMASVGRAFMEAIEQARNSDPWMKTWAPAQCPSEIIFDLLNRMVDESAPVSVTAGDGREEVTDPNIPADPVMAFAYFVSKCASGLYLELVEAGKTDTQARNQIIHAFLDFAAGEACRVARREEREPNPEKWIGATAKAFERAVKRSALSPNANADTKSADGTTDR